MGANKKAYPDETIWLRQPGEGEKAYSAFLCYLELGDGRTIAEVGRKQGKSRSQIDGWRSKYNWRERAAAYDNYLVAAAAKKARREIVTRYEQIGKNSDELFHLGMAAIKKAKKITPRMGLDAVALALKLAEANRAMFTLNEREQARDDVQNARVDIQYLKLEASQPIPPSEESGSNFIEALNAKAADFFPNADDMIISTPGGEPSDEPTESPKDNPEI